MFTSVTRRVGGRPSEFWTVARRSLSILLPGNLTRFLAFIAVRSWPSRRLCLASPAPEAHDSARGSRSSMRQDALQCTLQLSRRPGHFAICTRKPAQRLLLPCAEPYEVCCRRCSCAPGVCPGFPGWRRGHAHGLAYRVSCHVRHRRHRCASSSASCTQVCRCRAHALRLFMLSLSMLRTRTRDAHAR